MIKSRLFAFMAFVTYAVCVAKAQNTNNLYFTKTDGTMFNNNETIVANNIEDYNSFGDENFKKVPVSVKVHSKDNKNYKVALQYVINGLVDNSMQVCFLGDCSFQEEDGIYNMRENILKRLDNEDETIEMEYIFKDAIPTSLTITLMYKDETAGDDVKMTQGPSLNIKFLSYTTNINNIKNNQNIIYNVFNTQGIKLFENIKNLSTLAKGIYIVQKCNGNKVLNSKKINVK